MINKKLINFRPRHLSDIRSDISLLDSKLLFKETKKETIYIPLFTIFIFTKPVFFKKPVSSSKSYIGKSVKFDLCNNFTKEHFYFGENEQNLIDNFVEKEIDSFKNKYKDKIWFFTNPKKEIH